MKSILHCIGHKVLSEDIIRADNCILYDSNGNDFLDMEAGVWCTSIGHCNPRMVKALSNQASEIMHIGYCYMSPALENACAKILEITSLKNGKAMFLSSGSEAVDFAIRLSKHITGRKLLLTMSDSFLSSFGHFDSKDNWVFLDWLNNESLEKCPFDEIAAFIFEPGSSSGLVQFPPVELINKIVNKIHENGGLVICNEVTTGLGRTGQWFGYNHYNFIPDVVAMGKGLGNGYPVSCVACSENTAKNIDYETFHYHQSHQNDPFGAFIANEVINIIESENLIQEGREKGDRILSELNRIKEKYGIIKEVRGRGLMIAIEFVTNNSVSIAKLVNEKLIEKRIILVHRRNSEIFRMDPSLTIRDEDINRFIESFEYAVSEISKNV